MKNYNKLLSNKLLIMCIMYIILFTIILYSSSLLYSRNIYIKTEQKRAEQVVANINNALTYSIDLSQALSKNSAVVSYAQNDINDYYQNNDNILKITRDLSSLSLQNNSPEYLAIVNPSKNTIITSKGTEPLDFFMRTNNIGSSSLTDTLLTLQSINKDKYTIELSQSEKSSHIISCISYKTSQKKPVVFIVVYDFENLFNSIPKSNLDCIMDIDIDKNSTSFAYDEASKRTINFTGQNSIKFKPLAKSNIASYYWENISCTLYTLRSSYLAQLNSFFSLLVLIILGLFIFGVILTEKNVEKIYNPVKNLLSTLPINIQSATLDEFASLESHLNNLTSQKNVMSNIILNNKKQLGDKFLLQLATSTVSKMQIKEGLTSYGLDNSVLPLQVFILSYRNFFNIIDVLSIDGLNQVCNSIHEYFNTAYKSAKFFKILDIDQQTMVIIAHVEDSEVFIQSLRKNILAIDMLFDIDLVIFAGKISYSWYDISSSYTSALYLKNKCMVTSEQNIIVSSEENEDNNIIEYSTELENKFINSVLSGNINAALENIDNIINTNINRNILTKEHYTHFITMLYSTFIRILTQINKTEKEVFNDIRIYLELVKCTDAEALKITLTELTSKVISIIVNAQKNKSNNDAKRMLMFIEENYANDISLISIADYLNFTQQHTSKFFKEHVGENFKDYLTNFRLEKAIEIMNENPNIKLIDVADKVGMKYKSFTRAFVKKYGTTPSNYFNISTN